MAFACQADGHLQPLKACYDIEETLRHNSHALPNGGRFAPTSGRSGSIAKLEKGGNVCIASKISLA